MINILPLHLKDFMQFFYPIQQFSDNYLPTLGSQKDKLNQGFQCFNFLFIRGHDFSFQPASKIRAH